MDCKIIDKQKLLPSELAELQELLESENTKKDPFLVAVKVYKYGVIKGKQFDRQRRAEHANNRLNDEIKQQAYFMKKHKELVKLLQYASPQELYYWLCLEQTIQKLAKVRGLDRKNFVIVETP